MQPLRKTRKLVPRPLINFGKHLPVAILANLKYGFPGRKITVIGVTGTDGKTTTVKMIAHILQQAGKKVSYLSTINAEISGQKIDTGFHVTTPDPFFLQKLLTQALANNQEYMVLEVTSHSIDQYRIWGINFPIVVITNITPEHLDYHRNFANYLNTKLKLLEKAQVAVVSEQVMRIVKEVVGKNLNEMTQAKIITFGLTPNSDYNPYNFALKLRIPSQFNILNGLAAAAVAEVLGIDKKKIREALSQFQTPTGRMEEIPNKLGLKIIVDFAHTPAALEQALSYLRKDSVQRVIAVFGAASERDTSKRPIMGEIAAKLADVVILTDEDPRFENRMKIIKEIEKGCVAAGLIIGENLFEIPDRMKAIEFALKIARKGDVIGIFGKGHERSMNYQGVERPWSDQEAVKKALQKIKLR